MENTGFWGAARLKETFSSLIRDIKKRATIMEANGRDIVHLDIGEPYFDTPKLIVNETVDALKHQKLTHYAENLGYRPLRESVAKKILLDKDVAINFEKEILITAGATEAIFDVILALINPGDEVIIFAPAFLNYINCVYLAGGKPVIIQLNEQNDFQIDPDLLEKTITKKTKMVIINNPHNPTGTLLKKDVIDQIGNIIKGKNIIIFSDEIYDELICEKAKHHSMMNLTDVENQSVVINGFSKTYAMTGWRLGYVVANENILKAIVRVHNYVTGCLPTFLQAGLAESMLNCNDDIEVMINTLNDRRNYLIEQFNTISQFNYVHPEGAFYAYINIGTFGIGCNEFSKMLLEKQGVAVIPGTAFGSNETDFIRISYAVTEQQLSEGLRRLKEFVARI